jgi:hypothetical protein
VASRVQAPGVPEDCFLVEEGAGVAQTVQELQGQLREARDGKAAYDAFEALARKAKAGDPSALQVLIDYARGGKFDHVRGFICSGLAEQAVAGDSVLLAFFKEGLRDPVRGYWSILGYLRVAERESYKLLAEVALDPNVPLEQRAHAVKCLAGHAGQRFAKGAPSDPGHWTEQHIKAVEIQAWIQAGYPAGAGHVKPTRDAALDSPKTPLEKVVAKLECKLAKYRKRDQDPANPTNWLTPASPEDLKNIRQRWNVPPVYTALLTRFSPLGVWLEGKQFVNGLTLFGASDLIPGQAGYSESPDRKPLDGWPAHLLVIGADGGDPYVLDLKSLCGDDAPVLTAMHGAGKWEFRPVAESFVHFLETLTK